MLEKPNLPDEAILSAAAAAYGVSPAGLDFMPLGNSTAAWTYRLRTRAGEPYFLKLKKGPVARSSLVVPRYLQDRGIAHVVAPLRTVSGELQASVAGYALLLYPFVEGSVGMDTGLSERQWIELGRLARQVHTAPVPPELRQGLGRETFSSPWSESMRELHRLVQTGGFCLPWERELASFWREGAGQIRRLEGRGEALGQRLRQSSLPLVLCHGDMHTGNVLLDTRGEVYLVDWDGTMLAPKERDLEFIVGGVGAAGGGACEESWFLQGYGPTSLDRLALAYYRYERVLQDIADYGERVFCQPDLGEESKRAAARALQEMFQPGDVVEAVVRLDDAGRSP